MSSNLKQTIESIASKRGGLAKIAKARGKSQVHSSTQYPSFISKVEDIEKCLDGLGYSIEVTPSSSK